jgi:hypothetical protein
MREPGTEGVQCARSDARSGRSLGRLTAGMLASWFCLALVMLVLCTEAQAATGHAFLSSVSEAPLGTGLLMPSSAAVDRSSGRLFVGDPLAGVVDVYNAAGEYETQFGGGGLEAAGIAIDESSGDVYVADPFDETVQVYRPDGEGGYEFLSRWLGANVSPNGFGEVVGVAVDNSEGPSRGDLYVVEKRTPGGGGAVDIFKPKPNPKEGEEGEEGEFLGVLPGGKLERPNGIAVSQGTGRILVADSLKGAVFAYSASGEYEEKLNGTSSPNGPFNRKGEEPGNVTGVAVDEASGSIYVAETERRVVSQYSSKGAWEGWITETPEGGLGEPRGVALSSEGGVYLVDAGRTVVDRFGPDVVVPDVETGKVAKATLTRTAAVVSGAINGDGIAARYSFQYGETPVLGSQTPSKPSGTGLASVSAEVTGLHAGRTYYYRIVGENENATNVGVVRSFETLPAVEAVQTGSVKDLQPESATLSGTLAPNGYDAHYYFQWGTSTAYGNTSPEPPGTDAGSQEGSEVAEAAISGLSPNTLYHYRLVASNSFGTTYGADQKFTTSGPPRITYGPEPVTGITQTEATLHAQINPGQLATTYRFQYGGNTAYDQEDPEGGEAIGSGSLPVARSVLLNGLKVGHTYHYRVVAENSAGTTESPDQTFTTVPPAPVDATYVTNVTASEVTLHAQINPLGNDTRFYFQYGTQSCEQNPGACTNTPAPPGEDIGLGTQDVAREVKITGLQPDTTYHYRVLDSNALGHTEGPEHTFTTQQEKPFALPDNRAWELVTPPDKAGAPVEALTREGGIILASKDGARLTYVVDGALGENVEGNRSPEMQQVLATRGPSRWSSQDIATPSSKAKGLAVGTAPEYQFFSPDGSLALVEPWSPTGDAEPPLAPGVVQATPYIRDNVSNSFAPLVTEANTPAGTQFGGKVSFVAATPDLSHVVLSSTAALKGPGSARGLYEWSQGQLRFISLLPDNVTPSIPAELGFFGRAFPHAVSDDGSRVIWTKKEENTGKGHLYMRDLVRGETILLDAARGVSEPERGSAEFQTATSDGSRVFFTDKQRLTPDSTAEPGQGIGKPDLYECRMIEVAGKLTCALTDLTVDHNQEEHAAVQNFIFGAGEDGSSVYLVAQGVLAANTNGNGETAQAGQNNLYHLQFDGERWTRTFIATLSSLDSPEWEGGTTKSNSAFLTARVSPNGRYLAFMSQAPITGYENVDASPVAQGARDEEVFLYDSQTASLRCVSCNPSGARPAGVLDTREGGEGLGLLVDRRQVWGKEGHEYWLAGNIPGWTAQSLTSALLQSRYLNDEGRLYFNSPDRLVPAASNGKNSVYQYEPSGVGSCESVSGGCVSLLSGGDSDHESAFVEATPDGSNVFFVTAARLLASDTDTAYDIYDARTCTTESPCQTIPQPPPSGCEEVQTCRPASPAQPIPGGSGGSAVFSGAGNPPTPPQAQAQVKSAQKSKPRAKTPSRKQKLTAALKHCRRSHAHARKKRTACERTARRRYGPKEKRHNHARHKARVHGSGGGITR